MNRFTKAYYKATAFFPRRLPTSETEFLKFKDVILETYGFKDEPATMATMVGSITSTRPDLVRKPYGTIANNIKRLTINGVAQSYRIKAMKELEAQLEVHLMAEAEKLAAEEPKPETAEV